MSKALVSMAQQFSGLPIDSLIGGPLNAAAKANAAMALTQTKFMLDTCFNNKGTDEVPKYEPIIVNLKLTRSAIQPGTENDPNPKIEQFTTEIALPLLTIIPLNSLGVDNVDVTFEMEVKSSFSEKTSDSKETEKKAEGSFSAKFGYGPFSAEVSGSVSASEKTSSSRDTHYEKSNSAKYTIAVHAGQLPLPKGVNIIIEAYSKAIQPIELKAPGSAA